MLWHGELALDLSRLELILYSQDEDVFSEFLRYYVKQHGSCSAGTE